MKTIYLHIGTPKTGTTHLQCYLSHNKSRLLEDGLYYVADREALSACGIAVALGFWEDHHDAYVEDMGWFRSEMRAAMASKADSILLSSEMFCETTTTRRMRLIRRLHRELTSFGADRIIVICYLRRQDLFIESRHANDIIHWRNGPPVSGADPDIVAYADYHALLSDYRAVFGDNLVVRSYEKGQLLNGDILDDFLEQLDLRRTPECRLPSGHERNVRVRGDLTEMLRLYNLSGLGEARPYAFVKDRFLRGLFTPEQQSHGPGERFLALSKKKRAEILKRYAASNRKVAIEFLGRKDGRLFRDGVPRNPTDDNEAPGLQVEEITPLFMHMITELFDRTEPLPARLDTLTGESTQLESRCGHLESQLRDTEGRCSHLESQLRDAQDRYACLESQSRDTLNRCARLEVVSRQFEWRFACMSIAEKKLVGWGTSVSFRENHFRNPVALAYLVDNDSAKWGEKLKGIPIHDPGKLKREVPSEVIVIVYSSRFDEIAAQIAELGHFTVIPADFFANHAPLAPMRDKRPPKIRRFESLRSHAAIGAAAGDRQGIA